MRTNAYKIAGLLGWLWCGVAAAGGLDQRILVHKVAENFEQTAWVPDQWSNAKGKTSLAGTTAADAKTARGLEIAATFSGKGFEHFTADPVTPFWVPGDVQAVTVRYKISDRRYALKMDFSDGWGRDRVNGKYLTWDLKTDPPGEWKTATFPVPADWVRPVRINGITTHNWEAQNVEKTVRILVGDIEIDTDIKNVDPKTGVLTTWAPEPNPGEPARALKECPRTPLVGVVMTTGQESNVFTRTLPEVRIRLQNWKPGALTGTLTGRLLDGDGKPIDQFEHPIRVESSTSLAVPLKVARFGRFTLRSNLTLSDGTERADQTILARLPADRDLTDQQKLRSPYGLNVHSGEKVVLTPFRKAGIVWFREYAFSYDWLLRARGENGRYAGWPDFPKIVSAYVDAGAICLPVLQKSMERPRIVDGRVAGRVGPDRYWTREISNIINAFPGISHWELSNEYDLPADNWKAEELIDWASYRAYHRQFANILHLLGGGDLVAVENGRAGIWPQRELRCVQSGDFEHIGAVNSHYYCGTEAPEVSLSNYNMGTESKAPSLLFDELRAVKRAARADRKDRQSWLTEFGWDTLAGPLVSEFEQAVYLPRAWMMALAAGTDKAFWFYNFDAPHPRQFFDGCGLLDARGEPKLSLCAMAGLTSVLPDPSYVGDVNAGDNTCGYVFRNDGKLIAALWTIKGDMGPTVHFQAERLQDYLGNPIEGNAARLTMAPVYAVGLNQGDPWYKQTAYSLESPHLVPAAAGDPVCPVVRITNNRGEPISCQLGLVLPGGWTAEKSTVSTSVAPGEVKNVELPFTIAFAEPAGFKEAMIVVSEGQELKRMAVKVLVQSPLTVQVSSMVGRPGKTQVTVTVGNRSAKTISGVLRLHVPASWKAITNEAPVAGLAPGEARPVTCEFAWSADWKPEETAEIELDFGADRRLTHPLIPSQYVLHRARKITLDGKLNDWGPETRIPTWMLGSTVGKANASAQLAWAPEGIYGAVEVHDSKVQVKDPRSFWAQDALELFIDTGDNKQPRAAGTGDHQFWLMPQPDGNRVYLGQWKMNDEVSATRYDVPAIKGAAVRTADGYVMEFLIPADHIQKYHPDVGHRIGLNFNLTIQGQQVPREAYWPSPKNAGVTVHPDRWGTVLLVE